MQRKPRGRADLPNRDHPEDREAAAAYMADMAAELGRVARRHGLDTLGYLFDMARLEARNAAGLKSDEGLRTN